jgi:transposase InsO family protein
MLKAIEFAKEILKKKHIAKTTESHTLKRDTEKCVHRSEKELRYYCKTKGLNYNSVMEVARKELAEFEELKRAFTRLP